MKKVFVVLLVMCIALSVMVGCGSQKTEEAPKAETKEPATVAVEESTEPEAVQDAGQDEFMYSALDSSTCELTGCRSTGKKIVVPETIDSFTVVGIRSYTFAECNAEEIVLPDTVEYIAQAALSSCPNLVKIDLGKGLKVVADSAFNVCPALKKVEFPDGMTTIGGFCFGFCDSLEEVYIPASVTEIPEGIAFVELCPKIVIVTPAGSRAEEVANESGLPVRNS